MFRWGSRALLGASAVLVSVAAFGAATAVAKTPNLTGSWFNPAAPMAPAWHLKASSDRRSLTGGWRGAPGPHAAIRGHFAGTLNAAGTGYSCTMHITEQANIVDGTLTVTIDTANKITISTHGNNGISSTFTLKRKVVKRRAHKKRAHHHRHR
jgi:uncharacterized cupin superfamily protein